MSLDLEQRVHSLLQNGSAVSADDCEALLREWVHCCDRSARCEDAGLNDAHVVGMGLSCLCAKSMHDVDFDWSTELAPVQDKVLVPELPLRHMSWTDLKQVLTGLQIEFNSCFIVNDNSCYVALVDMITILLMSMSRIGFLLTHKWRPTHDTDSSLSIEDTENIVTVSREGWREISTANIVQMLDAVHALCAGTVLIMSAQPLAQTYVVEPLHEYHREASLDEFYELSQVVDSPWGSVTQYAHRFVHLFHSVSQVVYYHFPTYERRRQKPLQDLVGDTVDNVHVLPLLLQQEPSIGVVYEHTGLGVREQHARTPWQWVVVGGFVLLSDSNLDVWFGDARQLLAFARAKHSAADDTAAQARAAGI